MENEDSENKDCSAVLEILKWCSLLEPNNINAPLLMTLSKLERPDFNQGMAKALAFSLIQRNGDFIAIKEIIQYLIQEHLHMDDLKESITHLEDLLLKELKPSAMAASHIARKLPFIKHSQWLLTTLKAEHMLSTPGASQLYGVIGEYQLMQGFFRLAETHLNLALDKAAQASELTALWNISKALLYEAEGRYSEALQAIERASPWKTQVQDIYPARYLQWELTETYLYDDLLLEHCAERSLDTALEHFDSYVESLLPEEAAELRMEFLNVRGNLYLQKKEIQKAANMYKEVLSIGNDRFKDRAEMIPAYVWAYGNMAYAELELNEDELGLAHFERQGELLEGIYENVLHPELAFQKYSLGQYYLQKDQDGSKIQAADCFSSALEILNKLNIEKKHPLAAKIHLQYAWIYHSLGQFKDASDHCLQGLEIANTIPGSIMKSQLEVSILIIDANVQIQLQNLENAKKSLKKARRVCLTTKVLKPVQQILHIECNLFMIHIAEFIILLCGIWRHKN